MLNREQLKQLRKEIVLNSLYISDYENRFELDAKKVQDFFDGYFEELTYITRDEIGEDEYDKLSDNSFYDEIFKRDNLDNLYNYYLSIEDNTF
jgi:hypothetical protein